MLFGAYDHCTLHMKAISSARGGVSLQVAAEQRRGATDRQGAARYLGIKLRTLDALLASGELPCSRIGRRVVILYDDLDALLERGKRERIPTKVR